MSKSLLASGMVVETRAGNLGLVIFSLGAGKIDTVVGSGQSGEAWFTLDQINEDLTHTSNSNSDIVAIYGNTGDNSSEGAISKDNRTVIWSELSPTFTDGTVVNINDGGPDYQELNGEVGMVFDLKDDREVITRGEKLNPDIIVKVGAEVYGLPAGYDITAATVS